MYDFHTHSLLSDGQLLPSELVRRYETKGYKAIAIADHVDASNIQHVLPKIVDFCKLFSNPNIKVIPAVELTHIPLNQFEKLIRYARNNGAKLIIVHGETLVEPVAPGTNKTALEFDIDILAHPGLISKNDAKIAANKGIYLELSARKGHCLSNGHVASIAREVNAGLVFNTDCHSPEDILSLELQKNFIRAAGLTDKETDQLFKNMEKLLDKCMR
jgi:histidinol phosphatase-like PHP family hydrolase